MLIYIFDTLLYAAHSYTVTRFCFILIKWNVDLRKTVSINFQPVAENKRYAESEGTTGTSKSIKSPLHFCTH